MTMPNREQAIFVYLDVAKSLLDSLSDNVKGTEFETEHFRHRIEVLKIGVKSTLWDMKQAMAKKTTPFN